jgi:hypothetical protein
MIENGIADRMGLLSNESAFQILTRAKVLEAQGKQIFI